IVRELDPSLPTFGIQPMTEPLRAATASLALVAMILGGAAALTFVGLGAGLLAFTLATRLIRGFLFGVSPWDPVAIAGASVLLLATATMATWIPARRAARVDP